MEIQDEILMKTYQNNTICLTGVIIYRKKVIYFNFRIDWKFPIIFNFRIAYISYAEGGMGTSKITNFSNTKFGI